MSELLPCPFCGSPADGPTKREKPPVSFDHLDSLIRHQRAQRLGGPFKAEGSRLLIEVLANETVRDAIDVMLREGGKS